MYDYAVVGGGVGGVLAGALLSHLGKKVILFEKLGYLGGCAGTFKRGDFYYNAGATTFVGLKNNMPLDKVMGILKLQLPVKPIDPSLIFYIDDKIIRRYTDFDKSLEEIERNFPNRNNYRFWNQVLKVNNAVWKMVYDFLPYPLSPVKVIVSSLRHFKDVITTLPYHLTSTKRVVLSTLGNIDKSYMDFIEYHILITAQAFSEDVPFVVGSLGLAYPNMDNYYVIGGMSQAVESFAKRIYQVEKKTKVLSVEKVGSFFRLITNRGVFESKRVILNKTVWNFGQILSMNGVIRDFVLSRVRKFKRMWGALTLYLKLKDNFPQNTDHHHLIILREPFSETGSRSVFFSLSDRDDPILSKDGFRSATVSTHTLLEKWENLDQRAYEEKKESIKERVLRVLKERFPFMQVESVEVGTPKTFEKYTERYRGSVGGIPIVREYYLLRYPSPITPVEGLYLVGDTVFPGQGWPGVALGAINLVMLLEPEFKL